jgi:hypothetical protein
MHFRTKIKRKFDSGGVVESIHKVIDWWTGSQVPPKVTNFLNQYGNDIISTLTISRAPIRQTLDLAIDIVSEGQFSKIKKKVGYDKFFHLKLIINGKWIIEKNDLFNIQSYSPIKGEEFRTVNVPDGLTISKFLELGSKGDEVNFYRQYDPWKLNCQAMVTKLLTANGMMKEEFKKFIYQDVKDFVNQLPDTHSKIKHITDVASLINRLIQLATRGHSSLGVGDENLGDVRHNKVIPKSKRLFNVI